MGDTRGKVEMGESGMGQLTYGQPVLSLFWHLVYHDVQELTSNWLSQRKHDHLHNARENRQ